MGFKPRNYWVLKDLEKGTYFKCWTAIGPCATNSLSEATYFPNKEEAIKSPAYSFWLTFYEPVLVKGKYGEF